MNGVRETNTYWAGDAARHGDGGHRKLKLICYDLLVMAFVSVMILRVFPRGNASNLSWGMTGVQFLLVAFCLILSRNLWKVYSQVWRYSRTISYLRLLLADMTGGLVYIFLGAFLPWERPTSFRMAVVVAISCLGSIVLRYLYTFLFELCTYHGRFRALFSKRNFFTRLANTLSYRLTGISLTNEARADAMPEQNKIRIAIVGAGRIGAMLAEELLTNPNAVYKPVCFIDVDKEKIGRQICGINVLPAGEGNKERLDRLAVQEVVFACLLYTSRCV